VKVKQTPELAINFRNNIVCVGDMSYLDIAWENMEVQNYLWDFGGGHISGGDNTATGKGPYYVTWSNAGKYTVKLNVSAKDGCGAVVSDTVEVHPYPEAKIGASATEGLCAGQDILLTASVNNTKYTYQWAPREFFDYDYNSPVVTAHADKSQYISLKVTNEYGCQSMDSIMIDTKPCCELLLPSAFSPNGDSKNDLFRILNPGRHKLVSLRVLNRYGEVVFETANEHDGWNGAHNGVAQEMGVYFYQVKYLCDGREQYLKGDVTLIR
jgi:gliding motility-associated-like protein